MKQLALEWTEKQEIRVVYLGGSITEGAMASRNENCWVSLVGKQLEKRFPEKKFLHFNAGIGGTDSNFGLLRVQRDVIAHAPDLLILEYAVNDSWARSDLRAAESILLSVRDAGYQPYICFVCTAYRDPNDPTACEKYRTLGKRYGIPVLDLRESLERERREGRDTDHLFSDGCHPNDEGHAFYAKEIGNFLEEALALPVPVIDGETLDPRSRAAFCTFRPVLHSPDFHAGGKWTERHGTLVTTEAGDTLEGEFEGSVFGLVDYANRNGGKYLFELDGEANEIDTFYSESVYQPACRFYSFDLTPGRHRWKITALGTKNEKSGGTEVLISSVVTRDTSAE